MFINNSLPLFQALQRLQCALNETSSGTGDRRRIFVVFCQAVCTTRILLVYTVQPEQPNKQTFHSMAPERFSTPCTPQHTQWRLEAVSQQNILGEDSGSRHVARTGEDIKVRDPLGDEMR